MNLSVCAASMTPITADEVLCARFQDSLASVSEQGPICFSHAPAIPMVDVAAGQWDGTRSHRCNSVATLPLRHLSAVLELKYIMHHMKVDDK